MNSLFSHIRYGSPYFLYIVSLFITTNLFGLLCNSAVSAVTFIVLSVVYVLFMSSSKILCIDFDRNAELFLSALSVISLLFSSFIEAGLITDTFYVVSDAGSDKNDMIAFSVIITAISAFLATKGTNTLKKCSNIIFFIPLLCAIPCIVSAAKYGFADTTSYLRTSSVDSDIISGIVCFCLFAADLRFLYKRFGAPRRSFMRKPIITGVIFIFVVGCLLGLIFGSELYSDLTAPLFAIAGATEYLRSEELLLIIFSLCILYRTGCKISFIADEISRYFDLKKMLYPLSFTASALSGLLGVLWINDRSIMLCISICSAVYITVFFIFPLLFYTVKNIKNK